MPLKKIQKNLSDNSLGVDEGMSESITFNKKSLSLKKSEHSSDGDISEFNANE